MINFTSNTSFKYNKDIDLRGKLILFWHGNLLMHPIHYQKFQELGKIGEAYVVISNHFDGNIISKAMEHFGIQTIRGSSSKGSIGAIKDVIKLLKEGKTVCITPDGPRGPYHSITPALVKLISKFADRTCTFKCESSDKYILNSWDKFEIPKICSRITFEVDTLGVINKNDNLDDIIRTRMEAKIKS